MATTIPSAAVAPQATHVRDALADEVGRQFFEFLDTFRPSVASAGEPRTPSTPGSDWGPVPFYVDQLSIMREKNVYTIRVDYDHVLEARADLAAAIQDQYYRFRPYLHRAAFEFVLKHQPEEAKNQDGSEVPFYVGIYNYPVVTPLRDLRTGLVGKVVSIAGTVTRTSEVRPELVTGAFICGECSYRVEGIDSQFRYTEPNMCSNCNNKQTWRLDVERSHFVDWQRVRIQEHPEEIPPGSMPRTLDVILRADVVEAAKAGDSARFTGTVVVIPEPSTLAAAGERVSSDGARIRGSQTDGVTGVAREFGTRELTYRMCLLATDVDVGSTGAPEDEAVALQNMTAEEEADIQRMKSSSNLYQRMVDSVAPNVFGHGDVKRGVLLMLFGGVHKRTGEGINLRGDINVCVVGDPSCAKSQFLKYVVSLVPRAVYTSGKASSAAGLTASVSKDEDTGEFCIEAGALMLADNGICCIDEFDKMDIKDQVAIHEAMEQQTISITKAGIQATLNARTSILAAANPIGGRYDISKTLRQNVAMTPPIMSRFDLFFVILDEAERDIDYSIATFIVRVHQHRDAAVRPEFSREQIQRYARMARTYQPRISQQSSELLVKYYKRLRQSDQGSGGRSAYRITVRQLESLIRLSEALARLHLDETVRPKYVHEAARLLQKSILHVESDDVVLEDEDERLDDGERARSGDAQSSPTAAETQASAENGDDRVPATSNAAHGTETAPQAEAESGQRVAKEKIKISWSDFRTLTNRIVVHLRSREERLGDYRSSGLTRKQIVEYLMEYQEGNGAGFGSMVEAEYEARRLKMVIARLVKKDRVLMELPSQDEGLAKEDRLLAVHPNYVID